MNMSVRRSRGRVERRRPWRSSLSSHSSYSDDIEYQIFSSRPNQNIGFKIVDTEQFACTVRSVLYQSLATVYSLYKIGVPDETVSLGLGFKPISERTAFI